MSLKYGLQRYLASTCKVNINEEAHFQGFRNAYKAVLVECKKEGCRSVQHKLPISRNDLEKLYWQSNDYDTESPTGLQSKVWFEIMLLKAATTCGM